MGKKRRDGRAAKRGNNSAPASSKAEARNSGGGGLQHTSIGSEILYDNGTYVGEVKDGKPHGKGTYKWFDGDVYEGRFKDGWRHGRGVCSELGEVYDGEWKGDMKHGWGTLTVEDGVYEGEFKEDKGCGRGAFKWADGRIYEGEFANGQVHGWGTMKLPTGDVYEGEWVAGEQHGKGTLKYPSGEICVGIWTDGEFTPNADTRDDDAAAPNAVASPGLPDGRRMRSQRSQQRRLEAVTKKCEHCGVDDFHYKLRVCSNCNLALYCSDACQKAASRSHRRICDIISELPSRDSDRLNLEYDKDKMVDLDAGLRYGTKYMGNLKHLQIDGSDVAKLSEKRLSSLLRSKRGDLDSVVWRTDVNVRVPGITDNGAMWKELHGLKQLQLHRMKFDDVQPLHDLICEQKNSLELLNLPYLDITWSKARSRQTVAQAVGACKHLVTLRLAGCVLMDSDLKVMLQDLPNLRVLSLLRHTHDSHEFTDNTCGLIARKCPGLQELNLNNHDHLSVRGIRKILERCVHLRSFSTTACRLSSEDVRSLLSIAPQLMFLSLGKRLGKLDEIVEASGGRTVIQFNEVGGPSVYELEGEAISSKTRENYVCQTKILSGICDGTKDPEVANVWAGVLKG
ncbi:hypothetical protein ACHAXT_002581 [Thalassiosira profunda]